MRPFIMLLSAATVAALISGCVVRTNECGDGYCGAGDPRSCPSDCAPPPEPYCGDSLHADPYGFDLGIASRGESCHAWSWAASVASVAGYYGVGVATCGVASDMSGYDCCGYACSGTVCDEPPRPWEVSSLLGGAYGIHGFEASGPASESRMQTEISNGRPVLIGYVDASVTHLVIVSGYSRSSGWTVYRTHDPYYGIADLTHDELRSGVATPYPGLRWSDTWTGLSPWANGCNYDFDPACGC